jgi:hypothetical protein
MESHGVSDLRFAETATNLFSFLQQSGFAELEVLPTLVRYGNGSVEVHVYHGHRSFEIGVEIEFRGTSYALSEVIRSRDPAIAEALRNPIASTEEGVLMGLRTMSSLLQTYGAPAYSGSSLFFEGLERQRESWFENYADDTLASQVRPKAEEAFRRGDYSRAAALYGRIRSRLTPAELKKLSLAEKRRSDRSD